MAASHTSPSQTPVSPVSRRTTISRAQTAPDKMALNGHFASVGENGSGNFENGVQVIDEDKEFKYLLQHYGTVKTFTDHY